MIEIDNKLYRITKALDTAQLANTRMEGGLAPYMCNGKFVARPSQEDGEDSVEGNPTSALFTVFLTQSAGCLEKALLGDNNELFTTFIDYSKAVTQLLLSSPKEPQGADNGVQSITSDITGLPNNYNTPILLAGAASLCNHGLLRTSAAEKKALCDQTEYICDIVKAHNYLPAIGAQSDGSVPSAFLTYWAYVALKQIHILDSSSDVKESIQQIGRWAENAVATMLADHHAGLTNRFDVIEMICATSIVVKSEPSNEPRQLARHAINILFEEHFSKGIFSRSRPVVSDREYNRVIFCSTYEALSYLMSSFTGAKDRIDLLGSHWENLLDTCVHLIGSWVDGKGAPNDQEAPLKAINKPTAFSTAAAISFMSLAAGFFDDLADARAKKVLNVGPPITPGEVSFDYPSNIGSLVQQYIKDKVTSESKIARDSAVYSMIFFGPPGTAKTSYAKKIASDIGWPLLTITQKDFLYKGTAFIDTCAEQVFRTLLSIKEVVILFDELEELVQDREPSNTDSGSTGGTMPTDRESRFLTTSMLPRIADLRERQRVVFIFATNRLISFDAAAIRLGRFDAIKGVAPLDGASRDGIIKALINERILPLGNGWAEDLRQQVDAHISSSQDEFNGMTYKDIEFFVIQMQAQVNSQQKLPDQAVIRELLVKCSSIDRNVLKDFEKTQKEYERPA